jgi:prevent-host-death family protein
MVKRAKWQLQDAKNSFSEVVEDALREGPQIITRRGTDTAVVVSFEEWSRLSRSRGRLIDVLRKAPRVAGGLDIARSRDTGRDVDL